MQKKVSIIIPVYNSEKYLSKAIKSCTSQSYENIEIIIIDDGSSDNSLKICKKAQKEDKRIKIVEQRNSGPSVARNQGIKNASGDYVFFLDSDDYISNNTIKSLIERTSNNTLFSVSNLEHSDETITQPIDAIMYDKMNGYVWGFLFERRKCPKFEDVKYCEDLLFLVDYIKKNEISRVVFLPKNKGYYSYENNNRSVSHQLDNTYERLKDARKMYELLNQKTLQKYSDLINKKILYRFESELQHSDKEALKRIVNDFELPKTKKTPLLMKHFVRIYKKKDINKLLHYYKIRNAFSSLIRKNKND